MPALQTDLDQGGKVGFIKINKCDYLVLSQEDIKPYLLVACPHEDNRRINPHGYGLHIDLRENILSPENETCKKCGFRCTKAKESDRGEEVINGLVQANIGTTYFVHTYRGIFEITPKAARSFIQGH